MTTLVVGLGAGGHAKVVIEILELMGGYDIVGLLDPNESSWGSRVSGVEILGGDDLLAHLWERGITTVFVGVGTVGNPSTRKALHDHAETLGLDLAQAIHPRSIISPKAVVGRGANVMAGAVINPYAMIGDRVIVNTGAIVEHDCVIEDDVHVGPGARLSGGVRVGKLSLVGVGAIVREGITIGAQVTVGAGAVVVRDVPDGTTVVGVPAHEIHSRS